MAGSAVITTKESPFRGVYRVDVALTCASGAVTRQPIGEFSGRLVAIYIDPVAGGGATLTPTADIMLTDETGNPIISDLTVGAAANTYYPSHVITDNVGVAVTAATTAPNVNRDIYLSGKVYLAIVNATTTDTGLISLVIDNSEGVR